MLDRNKTTWTLVALLAFATVFAQDEEPAGEEPDEAPAVAEKPKPTFDFAWLNWQVTGRGQKMAQYASPADGFAIRELSHLMVDGPGSSYLTGAYRGTFDEDYWVGGSLAFGYGATLVDAWYRRNLFYDDVPGLVRESETKSGDVSVSQAIGPKARLSLRYASDQQDKFFDAPKEAVRRKTRFMDASLGAEVGPGQATLGYTQWDYWDRTNYFPDVEVNRLNLGYMLPLGPRMNIDATYVQSKIKPDGWEESEVEHWSVGGDWEIAPTTDLYFGFDYDSYDLPVVENAYVRERFQWQGKLIHRFNNGWTAQANYRHRESERVRADHQNVEVPVWDSVVGKVSGRIADKLRLQVKGSYEHLTGWPEVLTDDTRTLAWDDRAALQAKVDWFVGTGSIYGLLEHRVNVNDDRDATLRTTAVTLGGNFDLTDRLSVFAEHSRENSRARAAGEPTFDAYFPGGITTTFGFSSALETDWFLTGTYTETGTNNANLVFEPGANYKGRYWTLGLSHRAKDGNEYSFVWAPWRYRDEASSQMGYDSQAFMVTAKVKF